MASKNKTTKQGRTQAVIITQLELIEEHVLTTRLEMFREAVQRIQERIALKRQMGASVEPGRFSLAEHASVEMRP